MCSGAFDTFVLPDVPGPLTAILLVAIAREASRASCALLGAGMDELVVVAL